MAIFKRIAAALAALSASIGSTVGLPATVLAAQPQPGQMTFQPAASTSMERILEFNELVFWIIVAISVFVLGLLVYVMWRFREKRNPTPSKTTHNTMLEVIWTVVPVIILVVIAIPSFRLLYYTDRAEDAEMTIKAIGRQWYWSYEYPDHGDFTFDAYMVADEDLEEGQPRLLQTDNALVLPVDTQIRILVTASDVLHSFAMPSMGLKMDAVPGQLNETWVQITAEGTYYGQCSEICGTGHAYMPIMIKAVSKEAFAQWVEEAKEEYAQTDEPADDTTPAAPVEVAAADETLEGKD